MKTNNQKPQTKIVRHLKKEATVKIRKNPAKRVRNLCRNAIATVRRKLRTRKRCRSLVPPIISRSNAAADRMVPNRCFSSINKSILDAKNVAARCQVHFGRLLRRAWTAAVGVFWWFPADQL